MVKPRYKPNTTVACVIHCDNKFLLVEEIIDGEVRFNQPAGHLEANETIIDACLREVKEETGLNITISALVCIYQFSASDTLSFMRFTFCAQVNKCAECTPIDPTISGCHWLTLEQVKARQNQLRSPLVLKSIEDYLHKPHSPLSLINSELQIIAATNNA